MKTLNVIQLTSVELKDLISEAVREELEALKEQLKLPKPEEYLTNKEVMSLFKISKGTVGNWVDAGSLIKHGIRGRVYFKRSELEQAMFKLK